MTKTNHLFHFIISGKINDYINYLKEKMNFKKNCDLIDYLLEIISKNIHNLKGIIGDHQSQYEFIDTKDPIRIDKYVRLKIEKYKILKKWHYLFNEYGISVILRDIIKFFYNGILKYGVNEFISMIKKKINIGKIKKHINIFLTHKLRISLIKLIIFSRIIEYLPTYI